MGDPEIIIKKLEAADIDQVSRFTMSDEEDKPLEQFIRRKARTSGSAQLTQTYVAKAADTKHVVAYISLMCAEVRLEGAYSLEDKTDANRYEYQPAIRIARLACCDEFRGKKVGKTLVEAAIGLVLLNIVPHAGCRFIILDAKRKSVSFYEGRGFRLLDTPENRKAKTPLMFLDLRSLV